MTNAAFTAHIRRRIQQAGIKARCRYLISNGDVVVQVNVPSYEAEFSEEEQKTIRRIALVNHMTWVRGEPIDEDRMTNPKEFNFYR